MTFLVLTLCLAIGDDVECRREVRVIEASEREKKVRAEKEWALATPYVVSLVGGCRVGKGA